jgi:HK97 family phage portal protein
MTPLTKIKSWLSSWRGAEGSWRGPFWSQGELGGWYQIDRLAEGWQRNLNPRQAQLVPIVYACVMANARAISLCYPKHKIVNANGRHESRRDSWQARLFRNPNIYETWPQYILNTVAELMFRGESISLIIRDDRFVPIALHRIPQGSWQVYIDQETKEAFYGIAENGNPLVATDLTLMIPARDIIHFRQHTPRHPLVGETPISAAAMAIGINVALSESQAAFFTQMRRPSGILSTDEKLTLEQMRQLRAAFDEQAKSWNQGGFPILASGLKFQQMSITSQDAQLMEAQRMTIEDVCRVFGVPPPIVADLAHATLNNAEQLAQHWLAFGLGSLLENIERSFDKAFKLGADEYIELDTSAILRTDFITRVDGLTKAVQGGLMAPNEARSFEGLPPVEGGETTFLQAQMTPVDRLAKTPEPPAPAEPVLQEPQPFDAEDAKVLYLHAIKKAIAA